MRRAPCGCPSSARYPFSHLWVSVKTDMSDCYENRHRSTSAVIPAEAGIHLQCLAISPSKNEGLNAIFILGGEGSHPHEVFRAERGI